MFLYSKWLSLPLHIRAQIAERFGFKKIRPTHVANDMIVDDGFNLKDVESAVSVENLQNYFDTKEEDGQKLLDMLVEDITNPKKKEDEEVKTTDTTGDTEQTTKGKKKKVDGGAVLPITK